MTTKVRQDNSIYSSSRKMARGNVSWRTSLSSVVSLCSLLVAMSLGQEPQYKTPNILNKGTSRATDLLETRPSPFTAS